jgi:hypothetical protein
MNQIAGYVGPFLLLSALVLWAFRLEKRRAVWRWGALAACAALMFVRIEGLPIVAYARGALGDLSITTFLLLMNYIFGQLSGRRLLSDRDRATVLTCAAFSGLLLYPMALGVTFYDPYRLGYASLPMTLALLALAVWWGFTRRGAGAIIAIGVLAFDLRVLESPNLWDYLMDPCVALYACVWGVGRIGGYLRMRRAAGSRSLSRMALT